MKRQHRLDRDVTRSKRAWKRYGEKLLKVPGMLNAVLKLRRDIGGGCYVGDTLENAKKPLIHSQL